MTCLQTSILNTQSLTNNNAEKNLSKCGNGNLGSTQKTLKQQRDLHKKNKEVEEKKKKVNKKIEFGRFYWCCLL